MSTKYKATTTDEACFITITTVGWVDIFTRLNQKYNIVNDLQYCQEKKGLEIYAYCIMHSHIHLMCKATSGFILSDVMRDYKKIHFQENYSNYYRRTRESQGVAFGLF